jgi:hypothetical protein
MELEAIMNSLEEIPEAFRGLYTEKNGKWELTGIKGVKTQADIDRLQESLNKEKKDHKGVRDKLALWSELDHADVMKKLERYPELEEASKGKIDDAKLDQLATQRAESIIKSRLSPLERENKELKKRAGDLEKENSTYKTKEVTRTIQDELRKELAESKALPEAFDDAFLLGERVLEIAEDGKVVTKENVGWTPGIGPKAWVAELQERRSHWWPPSKGGNAPGSGPKGSGFGGANPWSHDGWNVTEQGKFVTKFGQEKAEQMAKAAGTKLGGLKPQPRQRA